MKAILSTGYSINFNEDAYVKLARYLSNNELSTIFVLVDENTHELCCSEFLKKLSTDKLITVIEIRDGEVNKNINTCVEVWKKLTELGADRKSILINLGGGMVTDLGGFVASTFKRGIKFINIPTTLLSMVDASVGSKTGVDLDSLKNLIGVFSNPEMVIIDPEYLSTLSGREMRSGIAEIIKYGLTFDHKLLDEIKNDNWLDINNLKKIIYQSIVIKNDVVLEDINEQHIRKVLNFGHTVGHAIESYFLEQVSLENFTHGEAIAIGMVIESFLSNKLHGFPVTELDSIKNYIHKTYGKKLIPSEHYDSIIDLMKHDKKNKNGIIHYILLKNIADFIIDGTASEELVKEGLDYYNS